MRKANSYNDVTDSCSRHVIDMWFAMLRDLIHFCGQFNELNLVKAVKAVKTVTRRRKNYTLTF